jgi:alpha-tubulin suppressor-like RCC1 family protein
MVGDTVRLVATVRDAGGHILTDRIHTWASSNPSVASVTGTGLVSGVSAASLEATITATSENVSGSAAITVYIPLLAAPIAAGGTHSCVLSSSGAAYCWGDNRDGELGDSSITISSIPVAVSGGLGFRAIAAGGGHTCGVVSSGAAYCWGYNFRGQLGNGSTTFSSVPIAVSGGLKFSVVATGGEHTCGLTNSGAVYCWGWNYIGQLGNGLTTNSSVPVAVAGGLSFSALAAGGDHTCGLTSAGAAHCWGGNNDGKLGNGSTTYSSVPVAVAGGLTFSAIYPLGGHTCGLTGSGAAYCWGSNFAGQLGNGSTTTRSVPVAVSGGLSFSALAAGYGYAHMCGLTGSGAVYCWGANDYGQLGNGSTNTISSIPIPVSGGLTFRVLAAGARHTWGLTDAGLAYSWGWNGFGQLGNNSFTGPDPCNAASDGCSATPVPVSGWPP